MENQNEPTEELKENIHQATEAVEQADPPSMMGALKSFAFAAFLLFGAY